MRSSLESESVDIDANRASRWLIASAAVVFVCGVLAIALPLTFSVGVAGLLGWLFVFAAIAHLIFGIHFGSGTMGWHAHIGHVLAWNLVHYLVGTSFISSGVSRLLLGFAIRAVEPTETRVT